MKKLISLLAVIGFALVGCSDAEMVSSNISKDADQFKVQRRIVFTNMMTGEYLFVITGNCSIKADSTDRQLEVTCKISENQYQKHFFGLSETATYTVEQLQFSDVSKYKYEIVFKPESIIPITIDIE